MLLNAERIALAMLRLIQFERLLPRSAGLVFVVDGVGVAKVVERVCLG